MPVSKFIFRQDHTLQHFDTHQNINDAKEKLEELQNILADLQDVMFADDRYSVLICLQGMDTSGKDSLVREVFKNVNVNGVVVHSFKTPNAEELSHDYLWRHYLKLPERGKISVFNRTHYENVLVTRVHPEYILGEKIPTIRSIDDVNEDFFRNRMNQINQFEKHLTENGTIVLKFYLHLSKDEQKKRLLRRLEKPKKNWKFSSGDLKERKLWSQYMQCYQDMLQHTSTDYAPWFVIPADDKETARLIVAKILTETLQKYSFQYPTLNEQDLENLKIYEQELQNEND